MIKIEHQNLDMFALRHFRAIENFLNSAKDENSASKQDVVINDIFGEEYSLKKLILAKPKEIEDLILLWDTKYTDCFEYYKKLYVKFRTGKRMEINGEKIFYNALKLVDDLGIKVCPYCNRNFISNTDKEGRRTCDIDHFFPQSNFPFLAISFYNLIPACKACNLFKSNKWNTDVSNLLINPYDDRFDFDANLRVKILDSSFYHNVDSIKVEFSNSHCERTVNHIKAFHLDSLYEGHADYVLELIQKKYAYSEAYIDKLFYQYEGTLFKSRNDVLGLITSNFIDEDNLLNRPLAKLTKDIVSQLDL